jgi:hypothetical protein
VMLQLGLGWRVGDDGWWGLTIGEITGFMAMIIYNCN